MVIFGNIKVFIIEIVSMKKFILSILLIVPIFTYGQIYGEKRLHKSLGEFVRVTNDLNKIKIESHVTEQEIISHRQTQQQKMISEISNHRYEIYLTNTSILNNRPVDVLINSLKVFIDDVEVTKSQFPNGFSVVIKNEPVLIYWYETNKQSIDVKIKWDSINYHF